jgi:DNA (cytosine-5)-methyltransferase 3A
MNVLSLFDGISVARYAFDLIGIPVKNYYSSEIEKHAITVSKKNYPNIIRLGSVIDLSANIIPEPIDLLIGGSPCQDLSIAKKDRKGLEGERSGLFWQYVRIMKEVKPKWFILENVASMPQKDKDIISEAMGCKPVLFNASLVSAQCRKRLFWTNIPFQLPDDRGIILKDILQPPAEVDERMVNKDKKAYTLTASYNGAIEKNSIEKKQRTMVKVGHISTSDSQANRVYSPEGKSCTLSANGGGSGAKTGLYAISDIPSRKMVKVGHIGDIKERNIGNPNNEQGGQAHRVYAPDGVSPTLGSAPPNVRVARVVGRRLNADGKRDDNNKDIAIEQKVEIRSDDKSGTLTIVQKDNMVINSDYTIRKLTPIECERLQSLPDNYTEGIATTNRYKCLGNAFNADVIAQILFFLK